MFSNELAFPDLTAVLLAYETSLLVTEKGNETGSAHALGEAGMRCKSVLRIWPNRPQNRPTQYTVAHTKKKLLPWHSAVILHSDSYLIPFHSIGNASRKE